MSASQLSRRKLLQAVLGTGALAATGMTTAACGGGSGGGGNSSGPGGVSGDVNMWIYPIDPEHEKAWWPNVKKEFNKTYPNVNISVTVQPWADRDTQLTTAIAGGKAPDVVYLIPDQLPGYAAEGALAEVSDVIADDKDDFRDVALKAMTFQDKLYGVPILMGGSGTWTNHKVLNAAGVSDAPRTWDDMLAAAPKVKAIGKYIVMYTAAPDETLNLTYYPYLWEAGGQVLNEDGTKAAFNSDAGLAALKFIKKLVDNGYVPKDPLTTVPGADANNPVARGDVAVSLEGVDPNVPGTNLNDWDVGPTMKDKVAVDYTVVGGLSVMEQSGSKDAAKAWVKFLASKAQLDKFDKNRKYFAPRKSLSGLYKGDRIYGSQEKYLDTGVPGVIHPKARQLMDLIKPYLQRCLLGKISPEDALSGAESDVNNLLAG